MTEPHLAEDYVDLLRIRLFEEEVYALARSGEITGSVHLCLGQEAVPVGACRSLSKEDSVVATYRGHGWAISRGVPMADLFAELLGRDSALSGGRGGSAYLTAPSFGFIGETSIVGAGMPIGLGVSLARRLEGRDAIGVVALGDGALNQGVVHETLNMASVLHVPLLVVVENNGYAEMTPADALTAVPAHLRAAAYGAPGMRIDGNDIRTVQEAVSSARHRALAESTPVIVEAITHRLGGHYSGDLQAYRPPGELESARRDEPLARLARGLDPNVLERLGEQLETEMRAALATARNIPFPDPSTVFDHLYA